MLPEARVAANRAGFLLPPLLDRRRVSIVIVVFVVN
jgi:hypothetical protein